MSLSPQQQRELVAEAFDPKRVTLYCAPHSYFGPIKGRPEIIPAEGCVDCLKIYFIHELSQCPPDKREEKLSEIEEVMHKVVELVERGQWDFKPYDHAKIEFGEE